MAQDTNDRPNVFAAVTTQQWREKTEKDLKGASVDSLASEVAGGLRTEPIYTMDHAVDPAKLGAPGIAPFVRGAQPTPSWLMRQEYVDPRADVCATQIKQDLAAGVQALWICLGPHQGCRVLSVSDMDALLEAVDLAATSVCLEPGPDLLAVASGLVGVARRRDVPLDALRGCFGSDPLGSLVASGALPAGLPMNLRQQADLATWSVSHTPGMRAALVSAHVYHEAGCTEVQELAWAMGTGVEYVRNLVGAGLSIDDAMRNIFFAFSVSGDFFSQIAKLRAARWLWFKIAAASGASDEAGTLQMHARTSYFTKSRRDPWVNMLRASAECTAAALGGAQSIATVPFDVQAGPSNELARRVARNTQTVLREEAYLDEVADPAGGSWYVESLTEQFARAAWALFQTIEKDGGMVAAVRSGRVAGAMTDAAAKRRHAIASRTETVVGVNEFPHLGEPPLQRMPIDMAKVQQTLEHSFETLKPDTYREQLVHLAKTARTEDAAFGTLAQASMDAGAGGADFLSMAAVMRHGHADSHITPADVWHAAEPWEHLRDAADHAAGHGDRPTAFLTNLGAIASHKPRSAWTRNVLAAAGVATLSDDGHPDAASAAAAFKASGAKAAVVCGSDKDYATMLLGVVQALRSAGCRTILVAGDPGDQRDALRDAGVSAFLHRGTDLLGLLSSVHSALGVS